MKKGVLIILIIGIVLNSFASITLTRYDEAETPIETQQISDSKGNQIEVRVSYLEEKGIFFGEMYVAKEDNTVDAYVSYSKNYDFYTSKINYMKYEKPALYNTIKWGIIGGTTVVTFLIFPPMSLPIGIAFGGSAINAGILIPPLASLLAFVTSTMTADEFIQHIIQNYKEEVWIKLN
ncbi:hypothetical protein X925_06240 [Petrotoga sp. 9T1HF07.CasAA.8.2]|jgi:hypothetical protein|uniref:hypothetical protein n=1 Tax=Petrotoga sp. 9T1HF07.CasAA.8.2 TaxID=1434329 RepID=UPI000CB66638|nr:hypothetical protein [Petrotoga sp. 9T1HF07.CasAA.8.2]PNR88512.1 hypothetical protein X925_06240 [Petrotoga sp. 9T1HF07.CasAA.8.2]